MTFKYNTKRKKLNLILGILWATSGIVSIVFTNGFWAYGYLVVGVLYFVSYFYERRRPYLIIKNNTVYRHTIPQKSFDLKQLTRINRNSAGIRLVSETCNDLHINPKLIDKATLEAFNQFLERIEQTIKK